MQKLMRAVGTGLLAVLSLAAFLPGNALAQSDKATSPLKLKVGDMAPDFKLQYIDGSDLKNVSLSEYRGKKNVVLAFYIFAFTGG